MDDYGRSALTNVIKATNTRRDVRYNEDTIDRLLGAPDKVFIPERYVPEQGPELTPEEKRKRRQKAEDICRMLSGSSSARGPTVAEPPVEKRTPDGGSTGTLSSPSVSSLSSSASPSSPTPRSPLATRFAGGGGNAAAAQRQHLLQLNQLLARQVTERSRFVAAHALANRDLELQSPDDDDLSPDQPLPMYQQRDNFLT